MFQVVHGNCMNVANIDLIRETIFRLRNSLPDGKRREGLDALQPLVVCKDVTDDKSARCLSGSAAVCTDVPKEQ